jgi:hypothetical protein
MTWTRTRLTAVLAAAAAAAVAAVAVAGPGVASAAAIKLPTVSAEIAKQKRLQAIAIPAPPCPESGLLPQIPGSPVQLSNCGLPETPATTLPFLGPMVYWGGHVQTHPKEYLVLWGWGQAGAFAQQACGSPATIAEGTAATTATLKCDPDGAGRYMADFLRQIGGTQWAQSQSQYFQTDAAGNRAYVEESGNLLAGIWVDDANPGNLSGTSATNPAGPTNTYTAMAEEAQRAAQHFGVSGSGLINANFIIAQPPAFTDPNALRQGYCAFHDYTNSASPGNGYYNYPGLAQNLSYTNMPYVLAITTGGQNDCGAGAVNSGAQGKLDDFSIALGHEVEETVTDPGAEDIVGNLLTGGQTYYGGWYDAVDANENGDKCAYVGTPLNQVVGAGNVAGEPKVLPVPGALGNIQGRRGATFAVQSLWSNAAAAGAGYCAGIASTDLPAPLAGEPPYGGLVPGVKLPPIG